MKGNSFVPFMIHKGDGSTLNLDFTKMSALDSRFTFTRSTTATYIDSSGYVASAAINESRFDYDPTTLEAKGLLIEGSTANLTKRSDNAFSNAYWNTTSSNNVTAVDSAVTSPTGVALTASTLTEIAGASLTHHIHQAAGEFTPTVATSYTMSVWVKQPPSAAIRYVQLAFFTAGFGATAYMNYDIQAGTVGTGGAAITASTITAYPSGWYRITATAPATATGLSGFQLGFSTTSSAVRTESYTVTGGSEKAIYLWGAQVQTGFGASSYIPTTTAQVTRATDVCIMSGTNFTSWFNNTEGTVLFIGNNIFTPAPSNFSANYGFINAAGSLRISQYTRHTTGRIGATCRDSGGGALTFDSPAATTAILTTAEYKTAFALKSSDFAYSVNGAAVGLGDGVGVFETVASLEFARDGIRNGHIKVFKFWPTRLTNAQLIAIST